MNIGTLPVARFQPKFGARYQAQDSQKDPQKAPKPLTPKQQKLQITGGLSLLGSGASLLGSVAAQGLLMQQANLVPSVLGALNVNSGYNLIKEAGGLGNLRDPQ